MNWEFAEKNSSFALILNDMSTKTLMSMDDMMTSGRTPVPCRTGRDLCISSGTQQATRTAIVNLFKAIFGCCLGNIPGVVFLFSIYIISTINM